MTTKTDFEVDTIVGKSIEVQGKILYPIVRTSILRNNRDIVGSWIIPIAFVVEENKEKYVIPLTDEELNQNELFKMIS